MVQIGTYLISARRPPALALLGSTGEDTLSDTLGILIRHLRYSSKRGGGVLADPKVLSHFSFILKQSKANKCQYAKRLETVKKLFFKFFVKEFWKN